MKKIIRCIEVILQVVTVLLSIVTIAEVVSAWLYRRKLAEKAQDYLEDEFIPEANIGETINVYSPTLKENRQRIKVLLGAIGASCMLLVGIKVFQTHRD